MGARIVVAGTEGGWELTPRSEEGRRRPDSWVPGSYPASGPDSTRGPCLRLPWLALDPAAPVQPLPLPRLPALGGGQEKARGNRQEERGGGVL